MSRELFIGGHAELDGAPRRGRLRVDPAHLCTHGVVVGMTGSGKTGLLVVLMEEALRAGVPVLALDVKGDLANLALACREGDASAYAPFLSEHPASRRAQLAEDLHAQRTAALALWKLDASDARSLDQSIALRILTPGSPAGESVHVLSALERPHARWTDAGSHALTDAREALAAAVSMVLRLLDRDPDPARSREHVLLSTLAERRLRAGEGATLDVLIRDLLDPPVAQVGALELDAFVTANERAQLAAALNALLASPTFASWRTGASLALDEWFAPREDRRTPAVIVSVAHMDDDARVNVLGLVLEEALAWTRSQAGTSALRALIVVDEVFGLVPPHPAEPPTRRPIVSLMKQGRAFGVGMILATQNPMDLDYRTLSNAGLWAIGRLQTDADRARVIEGMTGAKLSRKKSASPALTDTVKELRQRWFVWRDAHDPSGPHLARVRDTLSWLRGPMTPADLRARR
jgi:hypothetical protein